MKTITYDETQWQLVPKQLTPHMGHAGEAAIDDSGSMQMIWDSMLEQAPAPTSAADGQNELKAIYAAARQAGWMFTEHANGVVCMEPLIAGEAQAADGQALHPDDKVDAERYREVRRMSLREFSEIYHANLSGKPFDALIDAARAKQGGQS